MSTRLIAIDSLWHLREKKSRISIEIVWGEKIKKIANMSGLYHRITKCRNMWGSLILVFVYGFGFFDRRSISENSLYQWHGCTRGFTVYTRKEWEIIFMTPLCYFFIGKHHEFFNKHMWYSSSPLWECSRNFFDLLIISRKRKYELIRFEDNLSFFLSPLMKLFIEFICKFYSFIEFSISCGIFSCFMYLLYFLIDGAVIALDQWFDDLGMRDGSCRSDIHDHWEGEFRSPRTQATEVIREFMRKHRYNSCGCIYARSAPLCLTIKRRIFSYILSNICNMYHEDVSTFWSFRKRKSIIQVTCISPIDRQSKHWTKISAISCCEKILSSRMNVLGVCKYGAREFSMNSSEKK